MNSLILLSPSSLAEEKESKTCPRNLSSNLGLDDVLEDDGVGSELADALTELLDGHLLLVEIESEDGFVVDVSLLLDVEGRGGGSVELLGDSLLGGAERLKKGRLEGSDS